MRLEPRPATGRTDTLAPAVKLMVVAAEDEEPEKANGDCLNGVKRMTVASLD